MQTVTSTQKINSNLARFVLDNGITLISIENPTADIIAGRIFVKEAGSKANLPEKAGLSHLIAATITKGCKELSSQDIAERVESIGASLAASAAADYFLVNVKTVTSDFPQMLQLAADILRSPTFPEKEVKLEKKLTKQNIKSQLEQPFNVAFEALTKLLYPNHPYGISVLGSQETVDNLTRAELQEYHKAYFRPDRLVISISGTITHAEAVNLVEKVFGDWNAPKENPTPIRDFPQLNYSSDQVIIPQETQQSIIMLGYLGVSVQDPDYAGLKLLSTYLGNGLSSRLFVELREKLGLAYDVSAFFPTRLDRAPFVSYIGTAPKNTEIALNKLREEIDRLTQTQLTPEELQAAKNKLLGQYALGKQTNAEIAHIFGWYQTLGIGIEFDTQFQENVKQVTVEKARAVAQKYLTEPCISIVGSGVASIEVASSKYN